MKALYERSQDLPSETISDGVVVVDAENDFFFNLNPVAAFVWGILETPQTHAEICSQVMSNFEDASLEAVEADVSDLLDNLQTHGLAKRIE